MHARCRYVARFAVVLGKQIEMMDRNRVVLNTLQPSESADFLGRQQKMKSGDVTQTLELRTQLRMCT